MIFRRTGDVKFQRHPLILVQERGDLRFVSSEAYDFRYHVSLNGIAVCLVKPENTFPYPERCGLMSEKPFGIITFPGDKTYSALRLLSPRNQAAFPFTALFPYQTKHFH